MKDEKVTELYERAMEEVRYRENLVEHLSKLRTICFERLIVPPRSKWFKKVRPWCRGSLGKKVYTTYSRFGSVKVDIHYICYTCEYEWCGSEDKFISTGI